MAKTKVMVIDEQPFFRAGVRQALLLEKDFEIFAEVLEKIEARKHLTRDGFRQIVNLVFTTTRITNKRYSKESLLS